MKLVKEFVINVLQILVVIAFVYVMLESWDASTAFHDERVAEYKTAHEVVYAEGRK